MDTTVTDGALDLHREALAEIDRLRKALEQMLIDPPATLDEPDSDADVIIKMREIAAAALARTDDVGN